jgi:hypothetical protein
MLSTFYTEVPLSLLVLAPLVLTDVGGVCLLWTEASFICVRKKKKKKAFYTEESISG